LGNQAVTGALVADSALGCRILQDQFTQNSRARDR
jgi:hypothetical protein